VELAVFSLPDGIDRPLAETAVIQAITLCAPLNEKPRFVTGHVVRSFVVFLTSLATLTVIERRTHFQQTKYRSGAKFSTAAKPRILRTEEMEVHRVSVQRVA